MISPEGSRGYPTPISATMLFPLPERMSHDDQLLHGPTSAGTRIRKGITPANRRPIPLPPYAGTKRTKVRAAMGEEDADADAGAGAPPEPVWMRCPKASGSGDRHWIQECHRELNHPLPPSPALSSRIARKRPVTISIGKARNARRENRDTWSSAHEKSQPTLR